MLNIVYATNEIVNGHAVLYIAYAIVWFCIFIGIISSLITFIRNRHDVKTIRIKRRNALIVILILLTIICAIIIYSIPLMKSLIN